MQWHLLLGFFLCFPSWKWLLSWGWVRSWAAEVMRRPAQYVGSSELTVGLRASVTVCMRYTSTEGVACKKKRTLNKGQHTLKHVNGTSKEETTNVYYTPIQRASAGVHPTRPSPALHDALELKKVANAHHLSHSHG